MRRGFPLVSVATTDVAACPAAGMLASFLAILAVEHWMRFDTYFSVPTVRADLSGVGKETKAVIARFGQDHTFAARESDALKSGDA